MFHACAGLTFVRASIVVGLFGSSAINVSRVVLCSSWVAGTDGVSVACHKQGSMARLARCA